VCRYNSCTFQEAHEILAQCVEKLQNNFHATAGDIHRNNQTLMHWCTNKCTVIRHTHILQVWRAINHFNFICLCITTYIHMYTSPSKTHYWRKANNEEKMRKKTWETNGQLYPYPFPALRHPLFRFWVVTESSLSSLQIRLQEGTTPAIRRALDTLHQSPNTILITIVT
jgi:hypothetical protein